MSRKDWVGVVICLACLFGLMWLAGCEDDVVYVDVPPPETIEVAGPEVPVPQHVRVDVAVRGAVVMDWWMETGQPVMIRARDSLWIEEPVPGVDSVPYPDTVIVPGPVRWLHCYYREIGSGVFAWRQADGTACPAP